MNVGDSDLFEWVFKGLVGFVLTAGAFMWNGLVKRVEKTESKLESHEIYSAKNYVERPDLNRVYDSLNEMSKDIKTLLGKVGQGKN